MQMRNYNDNFGNSGRGGYGNSNSGTGFNSKARGEQFRNRAIDGISKLDETDNLMADSMRLINDSKELGVSTLVKVDEQTEILANTKQNVDETLVMSNSAGSILNNMAYRYCANKALFTPKAHLASTPKVHSIKHELKKVLDKLSSKNNRPAILNGKRLHHVSS
eukprot:g323.t1